MTALAEALVAAQRRSLATLEKAYVAGRIEADPMAEAMEACGITDAVDRAFLIASLDVLREWGVAAPTMTERVARENGEPKKATEGQVSYIVDLLKKGSHGPLAEQDLGVLSFDRASELPQVGELQAGGLGRALLMPKRNLAQTEIPVGNEIGRKHDSDAEFERVYGQPAAARERLAYVEARRCTCGSPHPDKWGARWKHRQSGPRAGRKF